MNEILLKKNNKPTKSGLYGAALYGDVLVGVNSIRVYLNSNNELMFDIIDQYSKRTHHVSQWPDALWSDEITFKQ